MPAIPLDNLLQSPWQEAERKKFTKSSQVVVKTNSINPTMHSIQMILGMAMCFTISPVLIFAEKLPVSAKQVEGCDRPPIEFVFGKCPELCGAFSEDKLNECEQGPPYGCSYQLQNGSEDTYCCEYDPRFGIETVPITCTGDSVLFDGIDINQAIRVGYVLELGAEDSSSPVTFDRERSNCYNNVDAVTKRPELPVTVAPGDIVILTTRLYSDPFYLCIRSRRRLTECRYEFTKDGSPIGALTVKWRNIQGCFPNFSGFSD